MILTAVTFVGLSQTLFNQSTWFNSQKSKAAAPYDYDLTVYEDTSSGLAAIYALGQVVRRDNLKREDGAKVKVQLIKSPTGSTAKKAMPVNGLGIEDLYNGNQYEFGFLLSFRNEIEKYYNNASGKAGTAPYIYANASTRQSYRDEAANAAFDKLINDIRPYIDLSESFDIPSSYDQASETMTLASGKTFKSRFYVDASVEADMARVMGATYKVGTSAQEWNDKEGKTPQFGDLFSFAGKNTASKLPQAITVLPTLKKETTAVAPIATVSFNSSYINPETGSSYNNAYIENQIAGYNLLNGSFDAYGKALKVNEATCNIDHMLNTPICGSAGCTASIGAKLYELNQHFNDYRIPQGIYDWYFNPEKRAAIREEAIKIAKKAIRTIQTTPSCYSKGGNTLSVKYLDNHQMYVRGEVMIKGMDSYNIGTTKPAASNTSIASGFYRFLDRREGDYQYGVDSDSNIETEIPYGILRSADIANLLVTTAVSANSNGANTFLRMESARMQMGQAAGAQVGLALKDDRSLDYTGDGAANKLDKSALAVQCRLWEWQATDGTPKFYAPSYSHNITEAQRKSLCSTLRTTTTQTTTTTSTTTTFPPTTSTSSTTKPTVTTVTIPAADTNPKASLYSPSNGISFSSPSVFPALKAKANAYLTPRVKVSFRVREESTGQCFTSRVSNTPWLYSQLSGTIFSYTFSKTSFPELYPLTKGIYSWAVKAVDDLGNYSTGNVFCGSGGWTAPRTLIIR